MSTRHCRPILRGAGGAPAATLQQAAAFAWQEFIALNWPAVAGQRDVADKSQKFGASTGALVWETFRSKVEIFNTTKDATGGYAPPGYSATAKDLGYNTPPAYFYATRSVPACPGQTAPSVPAWINLDETTEIALAQMFAGGPAIQGGANSSPQLIRYAVKANQVEYEYVADPKNQYYIPPQRDGGGREQPGSLYQKPTAGANATLYQFPAGHRRDQERLAAAQYQ